ncbi:Inner membrane transport permease YbhR [Pelotomaculum sp. FP]|nr:ABC transporter permease [Pelotomaculum sp. FP]TEB17734.1 Inner membrane transport permease YbhR [Pelotomaculum sp. FP]
MPKKCLAIMRREFFYMWRDRSLRYILLIGPLLGLILFYATYSAPVIKAIPTAVVDLDRTMASRELSDQFRNTEYFKVVAFPENFAEAEKLLQAGSVTVGIVIPEDFARNTSLGRQSNIAIMIDGSNIAYATNATNAVLLVTRAISAKIGVKTLVARGIQLTEAQEAYQSITFREERWFNPALNYAYFLVLALALNFWQQCCMLAACMNVIGETGMNSRLQLKAMGVSKLQLFAGKSVAHIAAFMIMALPIYALSFYIFKLPLQCSFRLLFLFTLVFAVSLHSIGTLMSSFSNSAVNASRFGMIIALPSFVLCGYTWPLEAMPHYLQQLVKVLPQTWFFQGLNYLTFKNPGWGFISHYFLAMIVIALVCYGTAAIITSRN